MAGLRSRLCKRKVAGGGRAGVDSGVTMRVGGQGYPAPKGVDGSRPGDLLVDLIVEPSPVFERSGADLSMHAPVDFTDAALGTYIKCAACTGAPTAPCCPACPRRCLGWSWQRVHAPPLPSCAAEGALTRVTGDGKW